MPVEDRIAWTFGLVLIIGAIIWLIGTLAGLIG
jgi:hypothetical protein